MTIVEAPRAVTGGVDTHLDLNVAAALDDIGGLLGVEEFPTDAGGDRRLLAWLQSFGIVMRVGVEGTGSYGVGVARALRAADIAVVEVDRPNRMVRRRQGKSDPLDAIEAARAALSGRASGKAKTRDGNVEAIRALTVAQRSGRTTRTTTLNQLRHPGFCAPEPLRQRFQGLSAAAMALEAAALRPRAEGDAVIFATKTAMRTLGRRVAVLDQEKADLDELLGELMAKTAPELLALHGVGVITGAALLVAAGDNPERLRSEAAWAHLCGVAPLEASSGKIVRRRLNRGGDRQANAALWRIAMVRMRSDPRTRTYVARRVEEGRSKPEIIRVLKRYIAREVYRHLPRG
jgi:transposase